MTSNEKIKKLRESLKLTQTEFAKKLGVNNKYIYQIENGIRNPGLKFLKKVSDTFNVPITDLIGEEDELVITEDDESFIKKLLKTLTPEEKEKVLKTIYMIKKIPLREIPVLGYAQAGNPLELSDITEPIEIITLPVDETKNVSFAVIVKGDSMKNVGIEDGDILLIDANSIPESGNLVIAIIDNKVTFKKFRRVNGKVFLEPANENFEPIELTPDKEVKLYKVIMAIKRKKL